MIQGIMYVPQIKKNFLTSLPHAKVGLVISLWMKYVWFLISMMPKSILTELIWADAYENCVSEVSCLAFGMTAMSYKNLWHTPFQPLDYGGFYCLVDILLSLSKLKMHEKHVCEGCLLGKMQRALFLKDDSVRFDCRL